MGGPNMIRGVWVGLLVSTATCGAQAQITKCTDARGNVTYSDVSDSNCRNVVIVDVADAAASVSALPANASPLASSARTTMLMMTGHDASSFRQTSWANLPITHSRGSTDVATVGAARDALAATDRALAAMRTQKLASSR